MNIVEVVEVETLGVEIAADRPSMAQRLRRNWQFPVAGLAIGGIAALLYLNYATYEYSASYRVTPVRSDGGGCRAA